MLAVRNSLKLLSVTLTALFLLASCSGDENVTVEAASEELVVDSPAAVAAVRGGLPFELPKPGHSKQDLLPIFAESVPKSAEEE